MFILNSDLMHRMTFSNRFSRGFYSNRRMHSAVAMSLSLREISTLELIRG